MIEFVLNDNLTVTDLPSGMVLLDFIREEAHLKGTKTTCREGDCGACTVLMGELKVGKMKYKSIVSCLTPLGLAHGKHIVTIEGLNMEKLNPVQENLVEKDGIQCGFCTPGIVVSLTETLINEPEVNRLHQSAGNICRCTGYKSIERAIDLLDFKLNKMGYETGVQQAVDQGFIPDYFLGIPKKLDRIKTQASGTIPNVIIGGGTDLFVQQAHEMKDCVFEFTSGNDTLNTIEFDQEKIRIGSGVTTTEIMVHEKLNRYLPDLKNHFLLISSPQIRNTATLGGNIVNASPIGDLSIYFLALNSWIGVIDSVGVVARIIPLSNFFLAYKKIDLKDDEMIGFIEFDLPPKDFYFNFEKVSKRKHLDIASVNTAMAFILNGSTIEKITISAGGVAEIPLQLKKTAAFLKGKLLEFKVLEKAAEIMQTEIAPIDDIRGSSAYKRLLLRQLFYAHFIKWNADLLLPSQIKAPVNL